MSSGQASALLTQINQSELARPAQSWWGCLEPDDQSVQRDLADSAGQTDDATLRGRNANSPQPRENR